MVANINSPAKWNKGITCSGCNYRDGASLYDSTDNTIYALYGLGPGRDVVFLGFNSADGAIKYVNFQFSIFIDLESSNFKAFKKN